MIFKRTQCAAALTMARRRLLWPTRGRGASRPVLQPSSAFLPGELPARSLLARLLPLPDARVRGQQSGCSGGRQAVSKAGARGEPRDAQALSAERPAQSPGLQDRPPGPHRRQQCAVGVSSQFLGQMPATLLGVLSLSREGRSLWFSDLA